MRKTTLVLFILYLICSPFYSAAQNNDFTGSVLWRISGNGLSESSYVFGTNHIISKTFLNKIEGLDAILDSCKQVVGEINMEDEATIDSASLRNAAMMPQGKSYKQLLSKDDYNMLDSLIQSRLEMRLSQLEMLNPVTILAMYTIKSYNDLSGQESNSEGVDAYFQRYGRERGKTIIALETIEEQINYLFYSKSTEDQLKDLLCEISSPTFENVMEDVSHYYESGDLIGLQRVMDEEEGCPSSIEYRDMMYKNRNENWLEKIPALIQNQSSFIAVGCLHLVGEDGLLNRLTQMGYKIEAVGMQQP